MSKRSEVTVAVGELARAWGSTGAYLPVVGVRRNAGVTRLYLLDQPAPLEVPSGGAVDVKPATAP